MRFLIDAYNVIGQLDHIQLSDPNKVNLFVDWIERNKEAGDQMILVFDGQNKLMGFSSTEKRMGVTVIHTSGQRTADTYIKDKLAVTKDKSNIIVVTSDRDILYFAKKNKIKTITSKGFILFMLEKQEQEDSKVSPIINQKHIDYWLNEFSD